MYPINIRIWRNPMNKKYILLICVRRSAVVVELFKLLAGNILLLALSVRLDICLMMRWRFAATSQAIYTVFDLTCYVTVNKIIYINQSVCFTKSTLLMWRTLPHSFSMKSYMSRIIMLPQFGKYSSLQVTIYLTITEIRRMTRIK